MDKLIIPMDNRTEKDIDSGGLTTFIGYEKLRRLIVPDCRLAENEVIAGFSFEKDGVTIKFETVPKN